MLEFDKTYDSNDLIDKFGIYLDNNRRVEELNKIYKFKKIRILYNYQIFEYVQYNKINIR